MTRRCLTLLALTGAAAAACDYPTSPPMWDQTWVVPGETVALSVARLLPDGVSLNEDTSAFVTGAPDASITITLGEMCGGDCTLFDGLVVAKPAFNDTLTTSTTLPADLVSATLAGGSFNVVMDHNFDFDPLRPSSDPAAERGHVGITVRSAGNVVADTTIGGEDHAFPTGTTLSTPVAIRPVDVSNSLAIEIRIYSPAGDETTIESSDTLGVRLSSATVEIAEATVVASSLVLDPTSTTMNLGGLDAESPPLEQIQSGALRFRIENPFAVTGTMTVEFQLPDGAIQRDLDIAQGSYSARLEFTGDELRRILSSDEVGIVTSGTATAPDGTITVTPRQELLLESDFELVLRIGGSAEEG